MAVPVNWKRLLRRMARVMGVLAGIIILAWLSLGWYINVHKEEIRTKVVGALGEHLGGELRIRDLEPSVFRGFPNISLTLNDVSLRDSLWHRHRRSLLEARQIYVQVNPIALLSRRTEIKKITAARGTIFLYTDPTGYSNSYLLSRKDSTRKARTALVRRFGLEDMHLWFINDMKRKLFHIHFRELDGSSAESGGIMRMHIRSAAHIHELNFNITRGSYVHNRPLDLNISINYHIDEKWLHIPDQTIRIGGTPVFFAGNFYFKPNPSAFSIRLHSRSIPYRTAVSWMSPNIRQRLDSFDFSRPVALDARISGVMKYRSIPLVSLVYRINDNRLHTPMGIIERISYTGTYVNEAIPGRGHGDENSRIAMYDLRGIWQNIPFRSDTLSVTNLLRPVVKARIRSSFEVSALNNIVGGQVMSFDKGMAAADIRYDGGILPDDTTRYTINGYVRVADAGFTYLPRNLVFSNAAATLLFRDDHLFFRDITLRSRNSSISMEGQALHFLRLYFTDPGKVSLDWKVRGPMVNLNDFITFAGKRSTAPRRGNASAKISRIGNQLDRVLAASTISIDALINKMVYKNFTAEDVVARTTIAQSGIILEQVALKHGGGTLRISGLVNQALPNNPFVLKANVHQADVAGLFRSFDNFGQSAITFENLAGRITADADMRGNVTDGGALIQNSLRGTIRFRLKDGQLNRFSPFEKVGRYVFKKRNLSEVSVKDLQGSFEVDGNKIFIPPMDIQTSVVNMKVQGVYGLQGGTDIYMEIPLRNPEKEQARTPFGMLLRKGKGFVVHLRAQDETGAGLKIGWDPLRKGRRATDDKLER